MYAMTEFWGGNLRKVCVLGIGRGRALGCKPTPGYEGTLVRIAERGARVEGWRRL